MKWIRKAAAIVLMAAVCLGLFAGCGQSEAVSTEGNPLSGKKIGMTILQYEGLFASFADYVKTLCDSVDVELILDVGAFSPEDQVASIEKLIAAGCDGILYSNFGETVLTEVAGLCDEAGVYWAQFCRDVTDQEVLDVLNASSYYAGRTIDNNSSVGINIANEFHDLGITKTAVIGPTSGDSTTDTVDQSYKTACRELGIEICAEVRNCEEGVDCTKAVEAVLSSFPDIEGIIILSGASGKLEGIYQGLANMDRLGEIAVGALDASDTIGEDFAQGKIRIAHTGQYVDPGFSLALLLNAIAGTPLSAEGPVVIRDSYIVLRSQEDVENYTRYVENTEKQLYAYNGDEFKQFLKNYNPQASAQSIQAAAEAYSLSDVIQRHGSD